MKPIAIDLFCGAGGISEGLIQAGFHIIFSNELNKDAALTYSERHKQLGLIQGKNTWLEVSDIKNISGNFIRNKIKNLTDFIKVEEVDLVFGGPPCQGFSRAGRQNEEDERNFLFKEYLRIISDIKPKYLVFENVPGILDIKFQNFKSNFDNEFYGEEDAIKIIMKELKKIGYNTLEPQILNALNYGVPQNRHRMILIGYRIGMKKPSYPVLKNTLITVKEALEDMYTGKIETFYQKESINGRTKNLITNLPIKRESISNNEKTKHNQFVIERFQLLSMGESLAKLRRRILENGINLSNYDALLEQVFQKLKIEKEEIIKIYKNKNIEEKYLDILLTKKTARVKLNPDKPSNTIMTLPDDIISPYDNRIFSVRELARLQSFDDSFIFYGKRTTGSLERKKEIPQYSQVGNAVPPLLARAIAEEIMKVLQ